MDSTLRGILVASAIDFAFFLTCISIFWVGRRFSGRKAARTVEGEDAFTEDISYAPLLSHGRPLGSSDLSLFQPYLRFLHHCRGLFFQLSIVSLVFLFVNVAARPSDSGSPIDSILDITSASAHIRPEGPRVWILFVATCVYSGIIFYRARWYLRDVRRLMREESSFQPERQTLMLEFADDKYSSEQALRLFTRHSQEAAHSSVAAVYFPPPMETRTSPGNSPRRLSIAADLASSALPPPDHTTATSAVRSGAAGRPRHVGFVVFRSPEAARAVVQNESLQRSLQLSEAPPPADIEWSNMEIPAWNRTCRWFLSNACVMIASFFLTSSAMLTNAVAPVVLIIENAANLSLRMVSIFKVTLSGWFAPVLLFTFNSTVMPFLVGWAAHITRYRRKSEMDAAMMHGTAGFLIMTTLILPALGTGSIGAFIKFLNQTGRKLDISIGRVIVSQSASFAIRYILSAAFISCGIQLLQIPTHTFRVFRKILGRDTPNFNFGYWYAFCLSLLIMAVALSVIVPLVLPCGAIFFFLKLGVDERNFLSGAWKGGEDHMQAGAVRYILGAVSLLQFSMGGLLFSLSFSAESVWSQYSVLLAGVFLLVSSLLCVTFPLWGEVQPFWPLSQSMTSTPHDPSDEVWLRECVRSYFAPWDKQSYEQLPLWANT